MDWASWLRGILVVALFGWLLEALQPANAMRRYTRLVIGLLLMVAVLQPLTVIWKQRLPALVGSYWHDPDVQGLLEQGSVLQTQEQAQTVSTYRKEMSATGEAAAEAVAGSDAVSVAVTIGAADAPSAASVVLRGHPAAATQEAVKRAVATALGISQAAVRVDSSEGGLAP